MEEDINNLKEIVDLCEKEIKNNNYNTTATLDMTDLKSLNNLLNELERLQKENALNFEKTVQNSKLKYLIDSNLEKTEDGEYIVDSNACQTLVRHLIRIVDNEEYDVTCLHCGNDTPLYCEKCQQELITKNAELQLENNQLKRKIFDLYNSSGEYEKAKCIMTKELREYIPKQVIRDKFKRINETKIKINKTNARDYMIFGNTERATGWFINIDYIEKILLDVPGYKIGDE